MNFQSARRRREAIQWSRLPTTPKSRRSWQMELQASQKVKCNPGNQACLKISFHQLYITACEAQLFSFLSLYLACFPLTIPKLKNRLKSIVTVHRFPYLPNNTPQRAATRMLLTAGSTRFLQSASSWSARISQGALCCPSSGNSASHSFSDAL